MEGVSVPCPQHATLGGSEGGDGHRVRALHPARLREAGHTSGYATHLVHGGASPRWLETDSHAGPNRDHAYFQEDRPRNEENRGKW